MTIKRRDFLTRTAVLGAGLTVGFPHIWIKNSGLAFAQGGEIKVGVLLGVHSLTYINKT